MISIELKQFIHCQPYRFGVIQPMLPEVHQWRVVIVGMDSIASVRKVYLNRTPAQKRTEYLCRAFGYQRSISGFE